MPFRNHLSYYLRYLTGPFLFLIAFLLLIRVWRAVRVQMKISAQPATYFFLLRESLKKESFLPQRLFHTNLIGTASFADVRLRDRGVKRRHAQLFLYDGAWFLEPVSKRSLTWINGQPVSKRTKIQNNDVIGLGSTKLTLVDDRKYLPDDGHKDVLESITTATSGQISVTLILLHLFFTLCMGILIYSLPEPFLPHRPFIVGFSVLVLAVSDLIFLFLNLLLKNFNRDIFLAFKALYLTGFIIKQGFLFGD